MENRIKLTPDEIFDLRKALNEKFGTDKADKMWFHNILPNQEMAEKYAELRNVLRELKTWAEKGGSLQEWEEDSKFCKDNEWNQDKSDGYMFALFPIYAKLSEALGEKTFFETSQKILDSD